MLSDLRYPILHSLFVLLIVQFAFVASVSAQQTQPEFVPGEVLIKFNPAAENIQIQNTMTNVGIQQIEQINEIGIYRCSISNQTSVEEAVRASQNNPNIAYAEPNYIYRASANVPNDPSFGDLWGMQNSNDADIDAELAWDIQTGSADVIIGIIDTGVDYEHEDLADNMWRNAGESGDGKEDNGIDDDGNGFVDDVFGWNFISNDNDPMDNNGHGSHVAGTIGAVGNNNTGVVGVNWQVTLMALKFLDRNGSGTTVDAVEAIIYAADNNAVITNNSWGGGGESQALRDAIAYARDRNSLFVAAAGNDGRNTDNSPNYPSNYDLANIISVAASDQNERLASFSNYGIETVDLAAPGVSILSCRPSNRYQRLNGTSMATPHVAGVAGLILAQFPGLNYRQLLIRILAGVDQVDRYSDEVLTGGRLNAANALSTNPLVFVIPLHNITDTVGPYQVNAEAVDDASIATMTLSYSLDGGSNQTVAMQNSTADRYIADIPGQPDGTTVTYFVEAVDNAGNAGRSQTLSFTIGEDDTGCFSFILTLPPSAPPAARTMLLLINFLLFWLIIRNIGKRRLLPESNFSK